ncbi:DUF3097 domain-containing protein [Herbiconiux sp. KACC 21604]|uniref:DUF3097 domain-containing protein n=1 Tax=unclassified Herbiconiux TaxID=2618217 RepID=UPI001492CD80|nr:DUF3097 domain-containing protein [Herbiconiux sp. SALV-R1]WPO86725.1 DUF3097 domain-containing protein [Herbiconiux sp. KACC 21604]
MPSDPSARFGADRYGADVLADYKRRPAPVALPEVEAEFDLVVEEVASDFCGSVVSVDGRLVELEDRKGKRRTFPLGAGYLFEGTPVKLVAPKSAAAKAAAAGKLIRTASGSIAGPEQPARVARASRIYVEGRHDAELVEKIWGDDLRGEGVVVEYLEGVDDLDAVVRDFAPSRARRIGVLVDHLVAGSKESRIAEAVARGPFGAHVLVVGHPFVDIWQSVTPKALGIRAWPTVPRTMEWKHGICEAFGWPHDDQADIARAWKRILSRANSYTDLEPVLLGRVEQLIDFVTEPM